MKKYSLVFLLFTCVSTGYAQVLFTYDDAGNRIKREAAVCDLAVALTSANDNLTPALGQSVTLNADCTGGDCTGSTHTWSGNFVSGTGNSKTFYAPPVSGEATYTVKTTKSGCNDVTSTIKLNVQPTGVQPFANNTCVMMNVYGN